MGTTSQPGSVFPNGESLNWELVAQYRSQWQSGKAAFIERAKLPGGSVVLFTSSRNPSSEAGQSNIEE